MAEDFERRTLLGVLISEAESLLGRRACLDGTLDKDHARRLLDFANNNVD